MTYLSCPLLKICFRYFLRVIINVGTGHWFTISTLNLKPGYLNIYDSLNLEPDSQLKCQICVCYIEI